MKKFMRYIFMGRMVAFIVTVLTSIPLIVSHIKGVRPQFPIFADLHTWFGIAFAILAVSSMSMQRKMNKAGMGMQQNKNPQN